MAQDHLKKACDAIEAATAVGGPLHGVRLALAISEWDGKSDTLIVEQVDADMLVTDGTRQVRAVDVRLVALSDQGPRAKAIVRDAVKVLERTPTIRIFDITGISVELEDGGPAPDGIMLAAQQVSLR